MATITLSEINDTLVTQNDKLDNVGRGINRVSSNLGAFMDVLKSDRLRELEAERERTSPAGQRETADGIAANTDVGMGGLASLLNLGLKGLLAGVASVLSVGFSEVLNDVSRTIASGMVTIKGIFKLATSSEKLFDLFAPMAIWLEKLGGGLKSVGDLIEKVPGGGLILKVFGIFGKIFGFLGLVFTAYDTIKGAIEGFEQEGFIGGIMGALGGLLGSLVGAPLNLLKSAVSWTLGAFGWTEAEKWLDENIDFEKMINDVMMKAAGFLNDIFGWIGDLFGSADPDNIDEFGHLQIPTNRDEQPSAFTRAFLGTGDTGSEITDQLDGFRAGGGPVETGRDYLVGEKGPELFIPSAAGFVMPAAKTEDIATFLGNAMGGMGKSGAFADVQKAGADLKAQEDAMRASGMSDMEIAQNIMASGQLQSIMGSFGAKAESAFAGAGPMPKGPSKSEIQSMMTPNNLGALMTNMVSDTEAAKAKKASQPVVIQDNSTKVNKGGTSQTTLAVPTSVFDFDDPFVKGLRTI